MSAAKGVLLLLLQLGTFDVASVKRATTNRYVPPAVDPERFRIVATLSNAILWAYDIRSYQISGGSTWMTRDYYQIEGTTQTPATPKEMRAMLQILLADRFKLKLHRESKEMPVYALITGASGSKLQSAKEPCGSTGCIDVGPGEFRARSATMVSTAATLSNLVDRPVLDMTGLDGRYDFRMKFDPTLIKPYDGQPAPRPGADDPSIFVALQDLGLKLDPRRARVEILVIDSATDPSVN
jgi:uncharacterized protein (TIGR03435 family)